MAHGIPRASRDIVKARDRYRCARCGVPVPDGRGQWHHRRSRSVVDDHRHCCCNGLLLCATCHRWVHKHPVEATDQGLIVSRFETAPMTIPIKTVWGWRRQDCTGAQVFIDDLQGEVR